MKGIRWGRWEMEGKEWNTMEEGKNGVGQERAEWEKEKRTGRKR